MLLKFCILLCSMCLRLYIDKEMLFCRGIGGYSGKVLYFMINCVLALVFCSSVQLVSWRLIAYITAKERARTVVLNTRPSGNNMALSQQTKWNSIFRISRNIYIAVNNF